MIRIITIFLSLALFAPAFAEEVIPAPSSEDSPAVIGSAKNFLLTLDAGKYDDAWLQLAPEMQGTVGKFSFTNGLKLMRAGLGDLKLREPIALRFIKDLQGAPPGIYAAIFFNSDFQQISGNEKVILVRVRGRWMIAGYFFEKRIKFDKR